MVSTSSGFNSPTGPQTVPFEYRHWTLRSNERELQAILGRQAVTLGDIDRYCDMMRVIRFRSGDDSSPSEQTLDAIGDRLGDIAAQVDRIALQKGQRDLLTEIATSFISSALRVFMADSRPRLEALPSAFARRAQIPAEWHPVYIWALLNVLWESEDPAVVRATCKQIETHLPTWLTEQYRDALADVAFKADLRGLASQQAAWRLLFDRFRPASLSSCLDARRPVLTNRWLICLKEVFGQTSPEIPLEMAVSGQPACVSDAYLLLDWACRAWNMSFAERRGDAAFAELGQRIAEGVADFRRQHGDEVDAELREHGGQAKADYMQATFKAILGKAK
jgi:hypothetical protein